MEAEEVHIAAVAKSDPNASPQGPNVNLTYRLMEGHPVVLSIPPSTTFLGIFEEHGLVFFLEDFVLPKNVQVGGLVDGLPGDVVFQAVACDGYPEPAQGVISIVRRGLLVLAAAHLSGDGYRSVMWLEDGVYMNAVAKCVTTYAGADAVTETDEVLMCVGCLPHPMRELRDTVQRAILLGGRDKLALMKRERTPCRVQAFEDHSCDFSVELVVTSEQWEPAPTAINLPGWGAISVTVSPLSDTSKLSLTIVEHAVVNGRPPQEFRRPVVSVDLVNKASSLRILRVLGDPSKRNHVYVHDDENLEDIYVKDCHVALSTQSLNSLSVQGCQCKELDVPALQKLHCIDCLFQKPFSCPITLLKTSGCTGMFHTLSKAERKARFAALQHVEPDKVGQVSYFDPMESHVDVFTSLKHLDCSLAVRSRGFADQLVVRHPALEWLSIANSCVCRVECPNLSSANAAAVARHADQNREFLVQAERRRLVERLGQR